VRICQQINCRFRFWIDSKPFAGKLFALAVTVFIVFIGWAILSLNNGPLIDLLMFGWFAFGAHVIIGDVFEIY
jgi:hypothetical protein